MQHSVDVDGKKRQIILKGFHWKPYVVGDVLNLLSAVNGNLGMIHHHCGDDNKALASFESAQVSSKTLADLNPLLPMLQLELAPNTGNYGTFLIILGKGEEALSKFREYCQMHIDLANAHPQMVAFNEEGFNLLQWSCELDKVSAEATKRFRTGEVFLRRAISGAPDNNLFRLKLAALLGSCYTDPNEELLTLTDYVESEESPTFFQQSIRALALLRNGNHQKAIDLLDSAPEKNDGLPHAVKCLAFLGIDEIEKSGVGVEGG